MRQITQFLDDLFFQFLLVPNLHAEGGENQHDGPGDDIADEIADGNVPKRKLGRLWPGRKSPEFRIRSALR